MQSYRRGDRGSAVAEIRGKLATLGLLDNDPTTHEGATFDDACDRAVRGFQQQRGLTVDGVVGRETYVALDEARWRLGDRLLSYTVSHPFIGDDVVELQHLLLDMGFDCGRADGIFGALTEAALREFQRNAGLPPDGTCGPQTLRYLRGMLPRAQGGRPEDLRESEQLHRAGPTLSGKVVIIDPGHGGADRGVEAHGLAEADVVADVAARIEGRLTALGAQVFLTRATDVESALGDAVAFANGADADLVISLHVDGHTNPDANGVATYYFGTVPHSGDPAERGRGSAVGARLAELVQRELTTRTGLLDCRTHPKTWVLLRGTRMPAVRIEIGYLTNVRDAGWLASPDFRDTVAEGIVAAVQRLFLPVDANVTTGALAIPAV